MRKNIFHILIFLFFVFAAVTVKAQDPQFSQYYANPIYLNPALTGSSYEHRFAANYRNQWLGLSNAFSQYAASYDYNMADLNSGLGVQVLHDVAGTSVFKTTSIAGSYAYHTKLGKFTELRAGAGFSFNFKRINFDRLVFNDQLSSNAPVSVESGNYFPKNYIDANAGVFVNAFEYWVGFTAKHLTRPDVAMSGSGANLPLAFSLHGGYRFYLKTELKKPKKYISPTFNYRHIQKYDQLDLGMYYYQVPLQFGIWYRGLPLKHYAPGIPNNDALVFLVGYEITQYDLRIGYSYDLSISKLINSSTGSHELSIVYEIAQKKRRNTHIQISCPKF